MTDANTVRVRFAPSPTGYLHVGGARTALFNWLFARSQGGVFILRIEDTDRQRSTDAATAAILSALTWLGLDWDEGPGRDGPSGPYFQARRLDIYREHLQRLRQSGHAYPCFCAADELERRRAAAAEADGGGGGEGGEGGGDEGGGGAAEASFGYDGRCRRLTPAERERLLAEGRPCSWRLATPAGGATFWYDLVFGKREFQNDTLTDRIIVKADGFPTYNYAAVVDDHLMGITHVLRGDDHISNTPVQLQLYDAFGWPRPKFGHMPMILGPDRKRLSKRHGATSVEEFAGEGILPEAMVNYLALLGWSVGAAGDEVLTREQLVKRFSLKKVGSSPAAFDYDKLRHINAQHLKRLTPAQRTALVRPLLAERGWTADPAWRAPGGGDTAAYLEKVLATLSGRFSDLRRVPEQIAFFFSEEHPVDSEAVAAHLQSPQARSRLAALAEAVEAAMLPAAPTPSASYEGAVRELAERLGVPAGELIHPARVALTGLTRSAGIFEVMELLGGPRVVARLRRAAGGGA